jgi:hypothetical protein
MTYSPPTVLTFEQFLVEYGDNPRYELIDGELRDMEATDEPVRVSTNWQDDYARKVEEYAFLEIPEYWIIDFRGLGGLQFIGNPKQPTFTVCELVNGIYQQQQYRLGEAIFSSLFPNLQLKFDDIMPCYPTLST